MRAASASRWVFAAAVAGTSVAFSMSCGAEEHSLSVDVRTDYVPSSDFVLVRTEVRPSGGDEQRADLPLSGPDPRFVDGARVADFGHISSGYADVRVKLLRSTGETLGERLARVKLSHSYALTVVVTRSCEGKVCPEPGGDPARTTCARGECVPPECIEGSASCPPPDCVADADCSPAVACMTGRCLGGTCLFVIDNAKCPAGQTCSASTGCSTQTPPPPPPPMCNGVPCPAPNQCCAGVCTNVEFSEKHCGVCGNDCVGAKCCSGKCVNTQTSNANCGSCGSVCGSPDQCCAGICTKILYSEKDCGGCGNACGGTFPDCCDGKCLSKQQSEMNCGGCGIVCSGTKPKCCAGVCRGSTAC